MLKDCKNRSPESLLPTRFHAAGWLVLLRLPPSVVCSHVVQPANAGCSTAVNGMFKYLLRKRSIASSK
jgi:hypothetical protein